MPRERQHPQRGGFTRGPRIADLMTREYESFVVSSMAAERAGDAETALEYHRGIPMFTRSAHVAMLTQLVDLADAMPPWLWARWAAYQCTRVETPEGPSATITKQALQYVVGRFHGETMQTIWDAGDDPVKFLARTSGEDWAFHQVCTFELGGLRTFLDDLATGELAEQCGLARQWVGARMGGFRLETSDPLRLTVRDLATDQRVELLDLGAHVHAGAGGWLVGRLVPSGTEPAWMFDTRPLPVDEQTAREVAGAAGIRGGWLTAFEAAMLDGRFDPGSLRSEERELATDVPGLLLLEAGTGRGALAATMASLREGRDEVGRAAYRILRSVTEGAACEEQAAYVGAAALNPHAHAEARRRLGAPDGLWERWAELVPDPSRARLLALARAAGETAA